MGISLGDIFKPIGGGEARRIEAASNQFSSKYPLTNDCNLMTSTLQMARAELAQINISRPTTPGGKRIKARNLDALNSWIKEMTAFNKDLVCGQSYVPSAPQAPTPSVVAPAPILPSGQVALPQVPQVVEAPVVFTKQVVGQYEQPSVKCADGTYDVANGDAPPCAKKGGIYLPSLPAPAPAPILPSGQESIPSAPLPVVQPSVMPSVQQVAPTPSANQYSQLYDQAAQGTAIAQTQAPQQAVDNQKYLMYGGIALVGVLVLSKLIND